MTNEGDQPVHIMVGHGLVVPSVEKPLLFGLDENELKKTAGDPDKRYIEDDLIHLVYFCDRVILWLEDHDGYKFGWAEVKNPGARIYGHNLMGKAHSQVVDIISSHMDEEPIWEDYGRLETAFFEDVWLELQFEFGVLDSINFGVLYDESDKPQWPANEKEIL